MILHRATSRPLTVAMAAVVTVGGLWAVGCNQSEVGSGDSSKEQLRAGLAKEAEADSKSGKAGPRNIKGRLFKADAGKTP